MNGDARIGTDIAGFRIEELIRRGGMGVVYRAHQHHPRRYVALKLLAPELAEDPGFRQRFLQESNLAASIDHPNIIPVYSAGEVGDALFIAMRLVEGTDLKRLLRRDGRIDPNRTIHILSQVADALDVAHDRDLVHRDVKPSNILIVEGGGYRGRDHVYLSDFGLTKRIASDTGIKAGSEVTLTGKIVGTVDYVAPEQIQGKPVDGRSDQYALGCVLYECLAGRPPFPRESDMSVIYAHVVEPPPRLSEERPELHPSIDTVIARALSKEKDDRYPSCGALIEDARLALEASNQTQASELPPGVAPAVLPEAAPLPPLALQLQPPRSTGWRSARHEVIATNPSDLPVQATLRGDAGAPASVTVAPTDLLVEGGGTSTSSVTVRSRRGRLLGRAHDRGFRVWADSPSGPSVGVSGTFHQRPLVSWWAIGLVVVAVAGTLAGIVLANRPSPPVHHPRPPANDYPANFDVYLAFPGTDVVRDVTSTDHSENELPTWLDDETLVYVSIKNQVSDIWKLDLRTGTRTNLTADDPKYNDTEPTISRDRTKIAYVSDADGNYDIWTMNANGTEKRNITKRFSSVEKSPAWSPDGRTIAFVSDRDSGRREIWVMDADGRNPKELTPSVLQAGGPLSWQPDGPLIAFIVISRTDPFSVYVVNADTGEFYEVAHRTSKDLDPSWRPDGQGIVFVSDRSGHAEIWQVAATKDAVPCQLTSDRVHEKGPAVSPDGKKLAFVSAGPHGPRFTWFGATSSPGALETPPAGSTTPAGSAGSAATPSGGPSTAPTSFPCP
jgi:serine/threonine protein kinase/Tol biopolymer transport system component